MKKINVVYDGCMDDVDIIQVPDVVAENIEDITQEFFDWMSSTCDHGFWKKDNKGNQYLECETEAFIDWINKEFSDKCNENASIILQHTEYNKEYPSAEF